MDELAESIRPLDITLTELHTVPTYYVGLEVGILWMKVKETTYLRDLHNRLNTDLELRFGNTTADHDRDTYHFHKAIVMYGQLLEIYNKYKIGIQQSKVNLQYTASELGMFVYDEPMGPHGDSLCYRVLPIGGSDV